MTSSDPRRTCTDTLKRSGAQLLALSSSIRSLSALGGQLASLEQDSV